MRKRILTLCLALLLIGSACADVWEGTNVAEYTHAIEARSSGTLDSLELTVGQTVSEGDVVGSISPTRVYASADGTVAVSEHSAGDKVTGTVLEVNPDELYTVYCTVDSAYQSVDSTFVHGGETVYIKCSKNGTHRAVGVITQITGSEYTVVTTGGELFIGEVVYIYRDADFTKAQRVGIGTVVSSDPVKYSASGRIVEMCVAEGEHIERGELLFTYITDDSALPASPVSGIVTEIAVSAGSKVNNGQTIASVAAPEDIRIQVSIAEEDIGSICKGSAAYIVYVDDINGEPVPGTVEKISSVSEDGTYTVTIRPETPKPVIGLSVEVAIEN